MSIIRKQKYKVLGPGHEFSYNIKKQSVADSYIRKSGVNKSLLRDLETGKEKGNQLLLRLEQARSPQNVTAHNKNSILLNQQGKEEAGAFDYQKTLKLKSQGEILSKLKENENSVGMIDDRDIISEYDYKDKRAIPLPKVSSKNKKLSIANLEQLNGSIKGSQKAKSIGDGLSSVGQRFRRQYKNDDGASDKSDVTTVVNGMVPKTNKVCSQCNKKLSRDEVKFNRQVSEYASSNHPDQAETSPERSPEKTPEKLLCHRCHYDIYMKPVKEIVEATNEDEEDEDDLTKHGKSVSNIEPFQGVMAPDSWQKVQADNAPINKSYAAGVVFDTRPPAGMYNHRRIGSDVTPPSDQGIGYEGSPLKSSRVRPGVIALEGNYSQNTSLALNPMHHYHDYKTSPTRNILQHSNSGLKGQAEGGMMLPEISVRNGKKQVRLSTQQAQFQGYNLQPTVGSNRGVQLSQKLEKYAKLAGRVNLSQIEDPEILELINQELGEDAPLTTNQEAFNFKQVFLQLLIRQQKEAVKSVDRNNFRRHGAFTAYCNAVFNGGVFKKAPIDKQAEPKQDPFATFKAC